MNNTTMELRAETTHKIGPITPVMGPIRVECEKACFFHCPPDEELQPPADVQYGKKCAHDGYVQPGCRDCEHRSQPPADVRERVAQAINQKVNASWWQCLEAADAALRAVLGGE